LFFALWPDEAARRALARWVEAFYGLCGGRRMRTENLHITIAFLGMTERDRIDPLARAAATTASRKIELALDQPGYWRHNKIAWLGASEVPADLLSMVDELRAALSAGGFQFDRKPFVPHITLLRNARPPKEMPALDPVRWTVNGFVLLSSERDQTGPRYRVAAGPF
jgi:2'-5' RNA ligase